MTEATDVSVSTMIRCAKRELRLRERLYPGWIERKKIARDVADNELAAQRAIVAKLEWLQANEARIAAAGIR